ncbi:MAG TPA: DUF2780 domain-containing protein [Candidatus Polarisedimenticolia bacterium]|nr:DUF2780 domain-containing protein [Candidatus Polarisedimenticolia bacterium]
MRTRRRLLVLVCTVSIVALTAPAWAGFTDSLLGKDLDSLLGKQLGITGDQSKGGIGAILGLAKEKLSSNDYDKIAATVPGANKYVDKAKKMGLLNKPVGNKAGLDSIFSKLGIPKDKAAQMVPMVTDLVGKIGGEQAKALLTSVLG